MQTIDIEANTMEAATSMDDMQVAPEKKGRKPNHSLSHTLQRKETLIGWLYISPMVIGLLVFTAIPFIMSLIAMFYDWDGIHGLFESAFVGGKWFQSIFDTHGMNSEMYWKAMGNTLIFAIQLPICLVIGFFLAIAMNRDMKGVQVFRVIYYIPGVMSVVAVSIVWRNIFKEDGTINQLLFNMGVKEGIGWLTENAGVAFTVNLLLVWKGVGYSTLMFIAGLQSVSPDQIEAAKIDGANSWVILMKITLPALYPTIFYLFVTGLIGALQMFNEPFILLGGYGTGNNGMTAVSFVYRCKDAGNYGLASVGAWVLAFFIFIVTAIQMYFDRKRED